MLTKPSAAGIWERSRILVVPHRGAEERAIVSQSHEKTRIYQRGRYSEDLSAYGIFNYKIEARGLGSALVLEFLLYYMTKPEYQLQVREEIYLDNNMLDLF